MADDSRSLTSRGKVDYIISDHPVLVYLELIKRLILLHLILHYNHILAKVLNPSDTLDNQTNINQNGHYCTTTFNSSSCYTTKSGSSQHVFH